jgi:hypothetical protein
MSWQPKRRLSDDRRREFEDRTSLPHPWPSVQGQGEMGYVSLKPVFVTLVNVLPLSVSTSLVPVPPMRSAVTPALAVLLVMAGVSSPSPRSTESAVPALTLFRQNRRQCGHRRAEPRAG